MKRTVAAMGIAVVLCGLGSLPLGSADAAAAPTDAPGAAHPCRGATWGSKAPMFHSTVRIDFTSDKANDRFGFRVIMDPD